ETTSGPLPFGDRTALPRQWNLPEVAQPKFTTPPLCSGVASAVEVVATVSGAAIRERTTRDRNNRGGAMAYSSVGDEVWQRIVACHSFEVTRQADVSRFSHSPTSPRTGRTATNLLTRSSYWSRQVLPESDRRTVERELLCCDSQQMPRGSPTAEVSRREPDLGQASTTRPGARARRLGSAGGGRAERPRRAGRGRLHPERHAAQRHPGADQLHPDDPGAVRGRPLHRGPGGRPAERPDDQRLRHLANHGQRPEQRE